MADTDVWKNPADIMKLRRKRKSTTQKKIVVPEGDARTNVIYKSPSRKRRNPFGCSNLEAPYKRHSSSGDKENAMAVAARSNIGGEPVRQEAVDDKSCPLFDMLDNLQKDKAKPLPQAYCIEKELVAERSRPSTETTKTAGSEQDAEKSRHTSDRKTETQKQEQRAESEVSKTLPIDWGLKTKLRVVSSRSLQWCSQLKSAEEAHGITGFVRDSNQQGDSAIERQRQFQKSCMYWVHPNLPWLRLFPRIIDDSRASKFSANLMQEDIQASLQADWEESFTSSFHQLRSGQCPYFYLCTHQLTVLFCGSLDHKSKIVAMVTPTTRGFRESLENEGIAFSLPVAEKRQSGWKEKKQAAGETKTVQGEATPAQSADITEDKQEENATTATRLDDDGDEDVLATDDGASGWLESIGLDKKQFPSLDPRKVKIQREGFRVIDHRPESLVLVEGSNVQALFNFLLNCRTCTATSGVQAGVPPTILSPTPFKGATLKSHKVKHTVVKQSDRDGGVTHAHILEIAGPILPLHTRSLVSLFHQTQTADFGMVFSSHDLTVPFNILAWQTSGDRTSPLDTASPGGSSSPTNLSNSPSTQEVTDKCGKTIDPEGVRRDSGSGSCFASTAHVVSPAGDSVSESSTSPCHSNLTGLVKDRTSSVFSSELVENKPISDRVCCIKELVSTTEGFHWTT